MAKQSGLGDNAYLNGYDLSGDICALDTIRGGPAALDATSIDKLAYERMGGLRDGQIDFTTLFNDASSQEHAALKTLPTTDIILSYCRGTTLGNPVAFIVAKQVNYDPARTQDGALTFKVNAMANGYGLTWGKQLTAGKRTDTGATNGTGVDFAGGGSKAFGLVAVLHAFSFAGTDVTVRIQESSDDGGSDAYANVTGGAFTQITGSTPLAERIVTSLTQTVERYLRAITATTGGFSSLVFAVHCERHEVATAY